MSNDIEVRIGAPTGDLEAGMGRATRVIADSMSDIRRQLDGIGNMFNSIIGLAGGAGLAMLGRQAVGVMSNFEQLEIRLNSVMGSAGKGQEAFAWIQQFAKDTPYQVNEVTQSFMLLKNMGIDPMGGAMKSIADRAAQTGGGFETLQRISLGLGQAWTKGKLQGEEAMQLLEAGVPVWDMLSKVLGKTTAEVQELSSKGRLGRDVLKALIDEMGRSSEGAAEAQMKSLGGMWSNFIDNIEGALNRLRKDGALDPLKSMMSEMNAEFEKLESNGTLARWSSELAESIKAVGNGMASAKQFVSEYGDQIKFLAGAYVTLKAAQAGSNMVSQLTDEMRARVAGMAAAKEKAAADLAAANASSVAAKQALLLAESENTAARAELQRATAQAESWQAALRSAKAETDLAVRTQLTARAQTELTAALAARNAAVARAATATEALGRANTAATASTKAATVAQVAFERATTVAGLAARGFSTVMTALGGPVGIAIMALVALVTHWDDVAAAAGNAAAKSRKAADDIKQALSDVDVSRMRQGLKEATDEYNRLKLKRQTSGGNLTVDQRALGAAEDEARGRMLLYQKGLDDVQKTQAQNAYQPILDKYKGEDPEWRKQQEEKKADSTTGGPPKLLDEKEKKKRKPKEESRLSEWNNELDSKRLDAEMAGSKLSAQAEADFWQQKLALTKAGSKEREQVVRQHTHALLAIQREGDRNAKELEQAQMDARRQAQDTALQIDEAAYQREAEMLGLSAKDQESTLIAFEQRRLEIKQSFLDQRIAALERDPDHNIAEVYRLQQEREQAEIQHQAKLASIRFQTKQESMQAWDGLNDRLSGLWDQGLQAMMNGTLTWRNAMKAVFSDLSMHFAKTLVAEPMAKWLAMEAKKLAMSLGFMNAETAAATAAATTRTAVTAVAGTAQISTNAAVAASGAAASQAPIPFVGPGLAVAAAAAMMAMVMGMKGSVKSARGGYSIPRGVNPMTQLHEEEMVLPRGEAAVIRAMANGQNGGASSDVPVAAGGDQFHFNVSALDARSVERFFRDHGQSLVKALKEQGRNFAGTKK